MRASGFAWIFGLLLLLCGGVAPLGAAPTDPRPPQEARAYSDHTTPVTLRITWLDPLTREDGTPLTDYEFTVQREENAPVVVPASAHMFLDAGLVDGRRYRYTLRTRDRTTGALSAAVAAAWYAGGDPAPGRIRPVMLVPTLERRSYRLVLDLPAVQQDNTPLYDFGGISVYRNGRFERAVARPLGKAGQRDTLDVAFPAPTDTLRVAAYDTDVPPHEGPLSAPLTDPGATLSVRYAPDQFEFRTAPGGEALTRPLTITPRGGMPLAFRATTDAPWLTLDRTTATIPAEIVFPLAVRVQPAGLAVGTYHAAVTVASNDGPDRRLPVTLIVSAARVSLDTTAVRLAPAPGVPLETVRRRIENSGTVPLSYAARHTQSWLHLLPDHGVIDPGDFTHLNLDFAYQGLAAGSHTDSVVVTTLDPDHPRLVIPVELFMPGSPPRIRFASTEIALNAAEGDLPGLLPILIENDGLDALYCQLSTTQPWLSVRDSFPVVLNGITYVDYLTANPTHLTAGRYVDTLRVSSNDPLRPLLRIPVVLTVTRRPPPPARPTITLAPEILVVRHYPGDPVDARTIFVQNASGADSLHYTVTSPPGPAGWLTLSRTRGTVPPGGTQTFTVTLNPGLLSPGSYRADLALTSDDPFRRGLSLPVQMDVILPRPFAILPALLAFHLAQGATAHAELSFENTTAADNLSWSVEAAPPDLQITGLTGVLAPGATGVIGVTLDAAGWWPGHQTRELRLRTSLAPQTVYTVPIAIDIDPTTLGVDPREIVLSAPWNGAAQTALITVRNNGSAPVTPELVTRLPALSAPERHAFRAGEVYHWPVTFDPAGLDVGTYTTEVVLGGPPLRPEVRLPVTLTVTPVAPTLVVETNRLDFVVGRDAPEVAQTLWLRNPGSSTLTATIRSTVPWLRVEPDWVAIPPGSRAFVGVLASAAGLPGDASSGRSQLEITPQSPAGPTSRVTVAVAVQATPEPLRRGDIVVRELGLLGPTGALAPYVELANMGTTPVTIRTTIGLRVLDRLGQVWIDLPGVYGDPAGATTWPAGMSWLIAPALTEARRGLRPERVTELAFPAGGGTVILYEGSAETGVLHRFSFGLPAAVNAPEPGHALTLSAGATMTESARQAPRNSAGFEAHADNAPPPAADYVVGESAHATGAGQLDTTAVSGATRVDVRFDCGRGSYGTVGHLAPGIVRARDIYWIRGVPAGTSVRLLARLHSELTLATPATRTDQSAGVTIELLAPPARSGPGTTFHRSLTAGMTPRTLTLQHEDTILITAEALIPFELDVYLGSGRGEVGSAADARATARLEFLGLPPGASITSAHRYWDGRPRAATSTTEVGTPTVALRAAPPAPALRLAPPAAQIAGRPLELTVTLPAPGALTLELFDVQGRRLARREVTGLEAGAQTLRWPVGRLASGLYFVRVVQGALSAGGRLVVTPGNGH